MDSDPLTSIYPLNAKKSMVLVDNGFKPVVWLYRIRDNGLIKMANVEIVDHNTDYCLNIIYGTSVFLLV